MSIIKCALLPVHFTGFQVEGGKIKEGSRILLSLCDDAIAAGDGRVCFVPTAEQLQQGHINIFEKELWITNTQTQILSAQSYPPLCVVLQGGDEAGQSQMRFKQIEGDR